MTLSKISAQLPKEYIDLLEGQKSGKWIDVLKKQDKKKKEKGERVSKLYKTIVMKTDNWHEDEKLRKVAKKADEYLWFSKDEITKKAKARYKEVHEKFIWKYLKGGVKADKKKEKNKKDKVKNKKTKEIVQKSPLVRLSQDLQLLIASFVVQYGNDSFLNEPKNLSLFYTCKALNKCQIPFIERVGKGLAVGDILRNVKAFQGFAADGVPKKTIFQPLGKGVKTLDITGLRDEPVIKRVVKCFPNLEEVTCGGDRVEDLGLFAQLDNLQKLTIKDGTYLFTKDAKEIARLQGLTSLKLQNCEYVSNYVLREIAKLKNLTEFSLSGRRDFRYTENGLRQLAGLKKLRTFNITRRHRLLNTLPSAGTIGYLKAHISPDLQINLT